MNRKLIFLLSCFILIYSPVYSELVKKNDRVLILAPHPDDEAIGCAGIIQHALSAGADVRILYLTNGDSNQLAFIVYEKRLTIRGAEFIHMGEVRRLEAVKAMKLLGLDARKLIFLGYPDFGTFSIFRYFWGTDKPYKSLLTRATKVPYKENLSFGAPYRGESILEDFKKVLKEYRPNKIFVSHPSDLNADHKTLYLFLEAALADLNKELPRPQIYPYLIHWRGWPLPRHYHPELALYPPKQFSGSQIRWFGYKLTPQELEKKYKTILCYKSQTESSAFYLLAFCRKDELFGVYPEINAGLGNADNYYREGDSLVIRIDNEKNLSHRFNTMIYLFGYSYKTPFARMPKIRIVTRYKKFRVFDGKKMIDSEGMSLELKPQELAFKIPLSVLGNPDFLLASVKGYNGPAGVDIMSFRKVNIGR